MTMTREKLLSSSDNQGDLFMDDFNNNTPSGNEQQNTPESTGNFQSAPEAGNDAQRANSGSPYNGGISRITATLTRTAAETQITAVQMQTAAITAIQAETTATTAQTAHTVRAQHTAETTAMSITEIQANRRKNRLTISRQSIKRRRYSPHNRSCGLCGTRCYGHCGFSQQ